MLNDSQFLAAKFDQVNQLRDMIKSIEEDIWDIFNEKVFGYFKSLEYDVKLVDNKYDPINRYWFYSEKNNFDIAPIMLIYPDTFVVEFTWKKDGNKHPTKKLWNPYETSLDDFHFKHLYKTFKLL